MSPSSSCWYLAFETAYATWERGADISVKYQVYRPKDESKGETVCQPKGTYEPYVMNRQLHTFRTPWPYEVPNVCGHLFVFENDSPDFWQTVKFFTNGGLEAFGAAMAGVISTFMLF